MGFSTATVSESSLTTIFRVVPLGASPEVLLLLVPLLALRKLRTEWTRVHLAW